MNIGDKVKTVMGIPMYGEVIPPKYGSYTDGQYRHPEPSEDPVYVRWTDGTWGWIDSRFLERVY